MPNLFRDCAAIGERTAPRYLSNQRKRSDASGAPSIFAECCPQSWLPALSREASIDARSRSMTTGLVQDTQQPRSLRRPTPTNTLMAGPIETSASTHRGKTVQGVRLEVLGRLLLVRRVARRAAVSDAERGRGERRSRLGWLDSSSCSTGSTRPRRARLASEPRRVPSANSPAGTRRYDASVKAPMTSSP